MGSEEPVKLDLDRLIRAKMHVKRGDNLPFTGWNKKFSRIELAEIFAEAGFKTGAEVGVRRGAYSYTICEKNPGIKMFCIDPYIPYRGRRPTPEHMDRVFKVAQKNLSKFNCIFIRKTSMDAVKDFADGSLDFIYIDAMHEFDPVMMDIICWVPKVRVGGIVSGHDYVDSYAVGVPHAVRSYTYAHNINEWYITRDYGVGEQMPSWFWVKK